MYPEAISNTTPSAAWANDNSTFFYVTQDEALRADKLWRHKLASDPRNDEMVYHEKDDAFYVYISKTKSKAFLLMEMSSNTTTEVHYLSADEAEGRFTLLYERQAQVEYYVSHHSDFFYILTNEQAPNFKLMKTPVTKSSRIDWETVIPHSRDIKLDNIEVFKDYLVIMERRASARPFRWS